MAPQGVPQDDAGEYNRPMRDDSMENRKSTEAGSFILTGARLVLPDRVVEGQDLVVRDGIIENLVPEGEHRPAAQGALPVLDAGGALATAALVELHIHGALGIGFDSLGVDAEAGGAALKTLADKLAERGVGTFLPTMVCDLEALRRLSAAIDASGLDETVIPGIYVEGPFIAPEKRGGIMAETISAPDLGYLREVMEATGGKLRSMTVAPELPGVQAIYDALTEAGVRVCLGHSACDLERLMLPRGPYAITHLFNAMSEFSHKRAGLATLPFYDRTPWVELNADGVHVNDATLRACAAALDPGRLVLISDAAVAAGLPYGDYDYYGKAVRSGKDGVRYLEGTLMGSNRLIPDVLRNWTVVTGASTPDAVRAATTTPAKVLGLEERIGSLERGRVGRVILWDHGFTAPRLVGAGR